jgi:hypothetical protein
LYGYGRWRVIRKNLGINKTEIAIDLYGRSYMDKLCRELEINSEEGILHVDNSDPTELPEEEDSVLQLNASLPVLTPAIMLAGRPGLPPSFGSPYNSLILKNQNAAAQLTDKKDEILKKEIPNTEEKITTEPSKTTQSESPKLKTEPTENNSTPVKSENNSTPVKSENSMNVEVPATEEKKKRSDF